MLKQNYQAHTHAMALANFTPIHRWEGVKSNRAENNTFLRNAPNAFLHDIEAKPLMGCLRAMP